MTKIFTYQKKDKLKSRKQTQFLFAKGRHLANAPLRVIYTIEKLMGDSFPAEGVLQVGVGAPTRNFRKAVQRNRIKRLLREGYRLEKPAFLEQLQLTGKRVNLFFLYTESQPLHQKAIQAKIKLLLASLITIINEY